jgi:hypothetical protein
MCSLHEVVALIFVQSRFQQSYKQVKPTLIPNFKIIDRNLQLHNTYCKI